jgi:hypothetical protein
MTGLATYRHSREQMLFVLAGAGGLRIGEALGIEIDKHLSADCSTITVEQKARRGRVERRVKSVNAKREVDLHPAVASLLKGFIGIRTTGFLFETRNGTALTLTNVLRRHLHPVLKELGLWFAIVQGCLAEIKPWFISQPWNYACHLSQRIVVPFLSSAGIFCFSFEERSYEPPGFFLCGAFIAMVQAAESRMRNNAASARRANSASGSLLP